MLRVRVRHRMSASFVLDVDVHTAMPRLGVFGPSGAGKSTLLQCLAGFTRPAVADVRCGDGVWHDTNAGRWQPARARRVGYLTQDALLFPHYTVEQNLRYSRAAAGGDRFADVVDALGVGPLLTRMPRTLSGGEQQRVALGRALLSDPALLLLDEPFTGLDDATRRSVTALLDTVHTHFHVPWVVISHTGADLVALADEVVVFREGAVVAQGAPLECLAAHAANPQSVAHGIDNVLRGRVTPLAGQPGVVELAWGGHTLVAPAPTHLDAPAAYGCYANSIVLSAQEPTGQSARNHLPAQIAAVHPIGTECVVELRVGEARLSALVLERTATDMRLSPGAPVWANVKSTSLAPLS